MPGRQAPGTNNKEGRATQDAVRGGGCGAIRRKLSKDGRFLIQVPVEQGAMNVPLTFVMNGRGTEEITSHSHVSDFRRPTRAVEDPVADRCGGMGEVYRAVGTKLDQRCGDQE